MKVYGFKKDGQSVWFKTERERDILLKEEIAVDIEADEPEHPEPCEGDMTEAEFEQLTEFEGW